MPFSKTNLEILKEVATGNNKPEQIAKALKKDKSQIYRNIKSLKQYIHLKNKKIETEKHTHVQILLQALAKQPSFIDAIKGKGLNLLKTIQKQPKTAKQLNLNKSTSFHKLKQAKNINLIKKIKNKYEINKEIWPEINLFLEELIKFEQNYDERAPPGSIIYKKDEKEIIFSTKSKVNATETAFSAFKDYGIKIYPKDNTYYLPKKTLKKTDILKHTILITEKEKTIQNLILVALFYAKYKEEFPKIKHKVIKNIDKILNKENIKNYPTYEEIRERAEMYDIKI